MIQSELSDKKLSALRNQLDQCSKNNGPFGCEFCSKRYNCFRVWISITPPKRYKKRFEITPTQFTIYKIYFANLEAHRKDLSRSKYAANNVYKQHRHAENYSNRERIKEKPFNYLPGAVKTAIIPGNHLR